MSARLQHPEHCHPVPKQGYCLVSERRTGHDGSMRECVRHRRCIDCHRPPHSVAQTVMDALRRVRLAIAAR